MKELWIVGGIMFAIGVEVGVLGYGFVDILIEVKKMKKLAEEVKQLREQALQLGNGQRYG